MASLSPNVEQFLELGPVAGAVEIPRNDHRTSEGGDELFEGFDLFLPGLVPARVDGGHRIEPHDQRADAIDIDVGDRQSQRADRRRPRPRTRLALAGDGHCVVTVIIGITDPVRVCLVAADVVERRA